MARLAAWFAIVLLTLYLVFFGGGWQGIYTTELRSTSVVLAGLALGVWAFVAWRRPEWRPRSVLLPAIAACLASLAISTVFSRHPRLSVEYLGYAIVLAALYLLLVRILAQPWFRARMAALITALAVVIGGLFLVRVVGHWIDWWGLVGRISVPPLRPNFESLTFGNPAAVMTMSVLLTTVGVASIGVSSPGRRVVSGGLVVAAGLVTLLSGSRAGWLSVAGAIIASTVILLITPSGRGHARVLAGRLRSTAGRIAVALGAVGLAAGAAALAPAVLLRTGAGGEDLRLGYLQAATRMFAESPIFGTGPGTWVAQRILYTDPPTVDYYIPHAHNVYAQTLAELGFVGTIAGFVLFVGVVTLIRRAISSPNQRAWAMAAVFASAYFAAHQLLDLYTNFPSVMFAAALPIAWLDATATPTTTEPSRWRLRAGAWTVVGLAVAVAIGFLWSVEGPAADHSLATSLANDGEWADALRPARAAALEDPDIPAYQVTLGLTLARAGEHAEAAAAFRRAAAADSLPEAWLNLAAEEALLGDRATALEAIDEAMRLGYQRPAIAFAAGAMALTLDDRSRAVDAFAFAVSTVPSLAGDPWWSLTAERSNVFHPVTETAIDRAGSALGWEIALITGDSDRAIVLANQEGLDTDLATDVISAWGEPPDAAAAGRVFDRCSTRPFDAAALGWCARLSARAGDDEAAERYRAWAFTLGYDAMGGAELRVSTKPTVGRTVAGNLALFYGTYTYRRPTPWDLLVPSLVHLSLSSG